jgi:hypothetical protein
VTTAWRSAQPKDHAPTPGFEVALKGVGRMSSECIRDEFGVAYTSNLVDAGINDMQVLWFNVGSWRDALAGA